MHFKNTEENIECLWQFVQASPEKYYNSAIQVKKLQTQIDIFQRNIERRNRHSEQQYKRGLLSEEVYQLKIVEAEALHNFNIKNADINNLLLIVQEKDGYMHVLKNTYTLIKASLENIKGVKGYIISESDIPLELCRD